MNTRRQTLQGLETEFGFSALDSAGKRCDEEALIALLRKAGERGSMPRHNGAGLFLANGGLLYVDTGNHLEWATPECTSPREVVRFQRAGERLIAAAAAELETELRLSRLQVFKLNVCYASRRVSYGSHESCLYRNFAAEMPDLLMPFLVSRLIFTGAGGLVSGSSGIHFSLSPRAAHLKQEVSHDTMRSRGIFNTRNESLSATGYGRLHLICGDSTCSEFQTWLRLGSTMLVVAMIDAGVVPRALARLEDTVEGMQHFAEDPTCRTPFVDADNPQGITALDLQVRYLELAERYLGAALMPDWAEELCEAWRQTLEQLSQDPALLIDRLDWPLKFELMKRRVEQHSIGSLDNVAQWNKALAGVEAAMSDQHRAKVFPVTLDTIKRHGRRQDRLGEAIRIGASRLAESNFGWSQLGDFLRLRWELCELDMAFGDLSPRGLFNALDHSGALRHRLWTPAQCEAAITESPAAGRAKVRGDEIKRFFQGLGGTQRCSWSRIHRCSAYLDLSDPFTEQVRWEERPTAASAAAAARARAADRLDIPAFLRRQSD